jgi:hypothetical protein
MLTGYNKDGIYDYALAELIKIKLKHNQFTPKVVQVLFIGQIQDAVHIDWARPFKKHVIMIQICYYSTFEEFCVLYDIKRRCFKFIKIKFNINQQ